ncbi:MAG: hypothetical protein AAF567_14205 [Actinomycetota bacterium]
MTQRRRVGIVVVPRYFDTTPKELVELRPEIDMLHTQIRVDGDFGYGLDEIAACADEIEACAVSLADAGADVILQLGTPFSTVHGWTGGEQLRQRIEDRCGRPFEMMGLSVPAGVHAVGGSSVALATTYYGDEWVARYRAFAEEAGLRVVGAQSFTDQGHFADADTAFAAAFELFPDALIEASLVEVAEAHPDAEVIMVPGIPGRFVHLVPDLERRIGKPIVGYFAIWWRCLQRLGIAPDPARGQLFAPPA